MQEKCVLLPISKPNEMKTTKTSPRDPRSCPSLRGPGVRWEFLYTEWRGSGGFLMAFLMSAREHRSIYVALRTQSLTLGEGCHFLLPRGVFMSVKWLSSPLGLPLTQPAFLHKGKLSHVLSHLVLSHQLGRNIIFLLWPQESLEDS